MDVASTRLSGRNRRNAARAARGPGTRALYPPGTLAFAHRAWNYPIQIAAWKSALALAAEIPWCSPELSPTTAIKLAEIFTECGLFDGVFNVVQGKGETGQALVEHGDVAKVFDRFCAHGKRVMASAAGT